MLASCLSNWCSGCKHCECTCVATKWGQLFSSACFTEFVRIDPTAAVKRCRPLGQEDLPASLWSLCINQSASCNSLQPASFGTLFGLCELAVAAAAPTETVLSHSDAAAAGFCKTSVTMQQHSWSRQSSCAGQTCTACQAAGVLQLQCCCPGNMSCWLHHWMLQWL